MAPVASGSSAVALLRKAGGVVSSKCSNQLFQRLIRVTVRSKGAKADEGLQTGALVLNFVPTICSSAHPKSGTKDAEGLQGGVCPGRAEALENAREAEACEEVPEAGWQLQPQRIGRQ